jgi:zinc transport system ATP-binding protein
MDSALEVNDLTVRFGAVTVLAGVSFAIPRGGALVVIGPNGSGKTVLFKALIGVIPYEGTVRWAAGTKIGYVPQKLDIERDLPVTGIDFLRAKAAVTGASHDEIEQALGVVRVGPSASKQPIGALSGGQFQRLLMAAALVGRPTVLLLDEPTAGVDEPGQETMYETLERLRKERGLTILLISHDLSVVFRYATNVLCLAHEQKCFGPPKTVLTPEVLEELYGSAVGYHIHAP